MADAVLTDGNVNALFYGLLYKEGEDTSGAIVVRGLTIDVGLHPGRVAESKERIRAMLMELPTPFRESIGGGWSFMNACNDKDGKQWTDYQKTMQELFLMGEAAGLVKMLTPREIWSALPGGVPYYAVLDKEPERAS